MPETPTANNCCEQCEEANSDSAFTTLVGTWSTGSKTDSGYGTTTHITSNTSAVRYANNFADSTKPWRVRATAFPTFSATGAEHFTVILYGGAQDISNYVKLEFEFWNLGEEQFDYQIFNPGTGLTTNHTAYYQKWWYQLRLSYVELGGAPVLLASHPWNDSTGTWTYKDQGDSFPTAGTDREITLEICWDGEQLTGRVTHWLRPGEVLDAHTVTIASRSYTPIGGYGGFGTGPTLTDVSSVTWQDFQLSKSYAEDAEDCPECPNQCSEGNVPEEFVMTVDGTIDADPGWATACSDVTTGTKILAAADPNYPQTSLPDTVNPTGVFYPQGPSEYDWAGDGSCYWSLNEDDPFPTAGDFYYVLEVYYDVGGTQNMRYQIRDPQVAFPGYQVLASFVADITGVICEDIVTVELSDDPDVDDGRCGDLLTAEASL